MSSASKRPRVRWHRAGGMADQTLRSVVDVAQRTPGAVVRSPTRQTLFEKWTPEECWLAGLIWADGCLHEKGREGARRAVTVISTDLELAEQAAAVAGVSVRAYRHPNLKKPYTVRIGGWSVIERLVAVGLEPRKSLTATMPSLPHLDAFIRGYFDGDGCVTLRREHEANRYPRLRATFVGTHRMMQQIREVLGDQAGLGWRELIAFRSIWHLAYAHQNSYLLAQFMYANGGPCLSRKKRLFDEGMALPQPRLRG